ncbi:hypothetical protein G6N76_09560 [Rhizobium daejeonense]|uniref:Uncharacterized protein n=1 Tax=Rhizobium daejeonense TaxID=240521 RepID=A0A6M1RRG4_9HYPH|nr:hypothetical protein [Rhizobium daejeonense]NGO63922.1 hypothetical protein [Rhizobium daejeonense]
MTNYKFKAGDRVRYKDAHVAGHGTIHDQDDDNLFLVEVEKKDRYWAYFVNETCRQFIDRDLTLITNAYSPSTGAFVRLTADNEMWGKAGDIGKVVKIEEEGARIEFVNHVHGGGSWIVPTSKLEAWEPKVGERVRVTYNTIWAGEGIVADISNEIIVVKMGSGSRSGEGGGFNIHELEPVAGPAPAKASNDNAGPAEPKFKVGDRVRALKSSFGGNVSAGEVYSVTEVTNYGILFINKYGRKDGWNAENFELVTAAPTTPSIVALIENGQQKPAIRPKVHPDEASATTEAERLALAHPGQQFGVFILADSKIADLVDVPTAVLRAA